MSTKDILIAAKAVIEDPKNWTLGSLARDKLGFPRLPTSLDAVCFCSTGAVTKVTQGDVAGRHKAVVALDGVVRDLSKGRFKTVVQFNDNPFNGHLAVMKVFDTAIAAQE